MSRDEYRTIYSRSFKRAGTRQRNIHRRRSKAGKTSFSRFDCKASSETEMHLATGSTASDRRCDSRPHLHLFSIKKLKAF
jgi:hypothetical protein